MDIATEIQKARKKIDLIDNDIAALLLERARMAIRVAGLKKAAHMPIVDPEREKEVLKRASRATGPLSGDAMNEVFKKIVEITRAMEEGD